MINSPHASLRSEKSEVRDVSEDGKRDESDEHEPEEICPPAEGTEPGISGESLAGGGEEGDWQTDHGEGGEEGVLAKGFVETEGGESLGGAGRPATGTVPIRQFVDGTRRKKAIEGVD